MRTHFPRPSLGYLLSVWFFFLAALPAGAIGILLTRSAWNRELHTVQEQHLQIARNLAGALTRYADDAEAAFTMAVAHLAEHQAIQGLATLLGRLNFTYVSIVDRQGQVEDLVAPASDFRLAALPLSLIAQLQAGGAWEIVPDPLGQPTIFLFRPLENERYAIGALHTGYFTALQGTIAFGKRGHAVIVDRRGRVIAHPDPQWRATIRDLSGLEPVRHMMDGETGVIRFLSPALQAEVITGFSTVPTVGWGVMVPQPVAELAEHVGHIQRAVWVVIAIALGVAGLFGSLVSRWLAAPLRRIGTAAEHFATGSLSARVSGLGFLQTREAATLATQFNTMADAVTASLQAQHVSEQRFRDFAQIAADWFWETDSQQVYRYVSPSPEGGRQREVVALPGHRRSEYVFGDPEGRAVALIQRAMDQGEPFHDIVFQALGRDGQPVSVSVAGQPIRDAAGEVVGYRGVTRDITARLEAEAQLRQAQQAVQQRQAQKMEAIGVLAGGIAHDFNNILTAILGYTDLARYTIDPESPARRHLQEVVTAGLRAQGLVRQILTFSRATEPERHHIQLHLIVQEALKLLRASLPSTIEIRQHIDREVGAVLADPTQMHQVLINLCANAEHAMRDMGGYLDVSLDAVDLEASLIAHHAELAPGSYVRLTIRDTGHGMSPEVAGRIFEPFFTTKDMGQGTGMGLAVVHGIVSSHGGAITMQSTPGEGTTFAMYLPRLESVLPVEAPAVEVVLAGTGTILFVDDEVSIAQLGQGMLERFGYDVIMSTSSVEALATFRQEPQRFDLVITDQTMPQMTGALLARALRQIRSDIPIILCTGFSHTIDAEQAYAQGINAFLLKPLVSHDLGAVVQKVLARDVDHAVCQSSLSVSE